MALWIKACMILCSIILIADRDLMLTNLTNSKRYNQRGTHNCKECFWKMSVLNWRIDCVMVELLFVRDGWVLYLSINFILNFLQVQPSGILVVGLVLQKTVQCWMAHLRMATARTGSLARRVVVIMIVWAALLSVKCRQAAVKLAHCLIPHVQLH